MNIPGLGGLSEAVNKRMIRFLIHRYLGHLLKEKLCLEQLHIDLFQGTGTLSELAIDAEVVNEALESARVPLRLLDGYIGAIKVDIPWGALLEKSCHFEVSDLQLTFQPRDVNAPSAESAGELVGSMLESMVGSLASSMDMARSFLEEEETEADAAAPTLAEEGIEAFAHVIDAVLSRMKLHFKDTVVRVEHWGSGSVGTALELRLAAADVLDEQLEAAEASGEPSAPITTQPHPIHAVPDLNKLLHLRGLRLFTDVFSSPDAAAQTMELPAGSVLTSMYLRRQTAAAAEGVASSIASSAIFQSCVSRISGDGQGSDPPSPEPYGGGPAGGVGEEFLPSEPVQFAELRGERQTLHFRLRNGAGLSAKDTANRNMDLQMFLGALNVFLTPSQLFLLSDLLSAVLGPVAAEPPQHCADLWAKTGAGAGEKMMASRDFQRIETQLQEGWSAGSEPPPSGASLGSGLGGNWSGEERFYSTSARPKHSQPPPTIDEDSSSATPTDPDGVFTSVHMGSLQPNEHQEEEARRRSERGPQLGGGGTGEASWVRAKVASVWLCLAHEDPLASSNSLRGATATLQAWSSGFFSSVESVSIGLLSDFAGLRTPCDAAFDRDHLRFLGGTTAFDLRIERDGGGQRSQVELSVSDGELLEALGPNSVLDPTLVPASGSPSSSLGSSVVEAAGGEGGLLHVPILAFQRSADDRWEAEAKLKLSLTTPHLQANQQRLVVELGACSSEVDASLVDRLYQLLSPTRPSFLASAASAMPRSQFELSEDLFAGQGEAALSEEEAGTETSVDIRCPSWEVLLRVPVPDLRETATPDRPSWFIRRLRSESLRLRLTNAQVSRCPSWEVLLRVPVPDLRETATPDRPSWFIRRLRSESLRLRLTNAQVSRCPSWEVLLRVPVPDLRETATPDRPSWFIRRLRSESLRLRLTNAQVSRCPSWEVLLRVPVPDLRETATPDRPSWFIRRLRSESLRLCLTNAQVSRCPSWEVLLRVPVPDLRETATPDRPSWFIRRLRSESLRLRLTNAQVSRCPSWEVLLRVPVPDLRETATPDRPSWFIRRLRSESLRLCLTNAQVSRCPSWEVLLRVPVPDLRETATPDRPSWFIRRLRSESLRLRLTNAQVLVPNLGPRTATQGKLQLTCHSAEGALVEPFLEQTGERSVRETAFLWGAGLEGLSKCSLELLWDGANRSLAQETAAAVAAEDLDESASWNSYFQLPRGRQGPFSTKKVLHEDEELTIVGSRQDMTAWRNACLQNVQVSVSLSLPQLRLHIPGRSFYETLYNRVLNDLALWEPCSPAFARPDLPGASLDIAPPAFQLCRSTVQRSGSFGDSEEEGGTLDGSVVAAPQAKPPSKLAFSLKAENCRALLAAPILNRPLEHGEISLAGRSTELFLVSGFEGDLNLAFMYLTVGQLWLWHANLGSAEERFFKDGVCEAGFGRPAETSTRPQDELVGEPTPEGMAASVVEDDNFALGMRLEAKPLDNLKEILVTIGLRNTTLHHNRPVHDLNDWWLMELVELLTVEDEAVAGYEMPRTITELHVHAWSSALAYATPKRDGDEEVLAARLWLDDADLRSYIVQDAQALRLHTLVEDARLYVAQKGAAWEPSGAARLGEDFVCLLRSGFFELEVVLSEDADLPGGGTKEAPKRPLVEVRVSNEVIRVWTCADGVGVVTRLAARLAADAVPPKGPDDSLEASATTVAGSSVVRGPVSEAAAQRTGHLTRSDEEELESQVAAAMAEEAAREGAAEDAPTDSQGIPGEPSSLTSEDVMGELTEALRESDEEEEGEGLEKARTASAATDEDFCIVDDIAGSGVRSRGGEPRIRVLGGSLRPQENHFASVGSRSEPLGSVPPGWPQPVLRYLLKDLSLEVHLFSGRDFEAAVPAVKRPYSAKGLRGARGTQLFGQREEGPRGGPNRDHTVEVSVHVTRLCLLYELFGRGAPVVSRRLFTVQDVEVHDLLALSDINKLLYQFASEAKPRQSATPMLGVRCVEHKAGEARLRISALPLRANVDQDTLHFLQDFGAEAAAATRGASVRSGEGAAEEAPLLEVPKTTNTPQTSPSKSPTRPEEATGSEQKEEPPKPSLVEEAEAESESSSEDELGDLGPLVEPGPSSSMADSVATLEGLFKASGLMERSVTASSVESEFLPTEQPPSVSLSISSKASTRPVGEPVVRFVKGSGEETDEEDEVFPSSASQAGRGRWEAEVRDMEASRDTLEPDLPVEDQLREILRASEDSNATAATGGLYFTEVTFSPALTIRLDYEGKRRFDGGKWEGLLLGLSQLRCSEITLKELATKQGLKGPKVALYLRDEWIADVVRHQLPRLAGSVGPLASVTQILGGLRDLFVLPMEEWRSEEGHVVKGLQAGASSFGLSTATAAIDLTQGLLSVVQGVAGVLFEIVTPEYPPGRRLVTRERVRAPARAPVDLREGVGLAYDVLRQGTQETVEVLQLAAVEETSRGRLAVLGLLRQATPTLLRPILLAARASDHVLGGLKHQLHPDARQETLHKWKAQQPGPSSKS